MKKHLIIICGYLDTENKEGILLKLLKRLNKFFVNPNPKVSNIFAKIWSCKPEELISSYDAVSFHLPPETTGIGWYNKNDWMHVDASYTRREFECVQGFVTGFDINEGDASLTLLEGSNKYHTDFADEFNVTDEIDWVRLEKEDLDFYYEKFI